MTLINTSLLTGMATVIKIIAVFIINKFLSIYAGPSGLAIVGQLQDFVTMVTTFSNGATTQGIVKYTAEYKTIEEKQKIFSTSIAISLICSSIALIILVLFSDWLSVFILKDIKYSSVFIVFGFTVFLFGLNIVFMSILNGQKEIKKYVLSNIVSSLFTLFLTSILIWQFNIIGALYALVLNQSFVFFVTLIFIIKSNWFKIKYFKQGIDKDSLIKLSSFSLMAIVSAISLPLSSMIIRNYIGDNLSWDDAGYWQGIWYISTMYLMIITTSLSVYYLPKLSEISDRIELRKEIIYGFMVIIPIVMVLSFIIFLIKDYVILIAFSEKFMPMSSLFLWQLIGDVIKMASWLLAYVMIAKAMTKVFILTEIIFSITFVLLSIYFVNNFGLVGVTYAFCINYIFYFITIFISVRKVI